MRIGIVTYWTSSDNYGQQLQCYALQTYLKDKGNDVFLIRYSPENQYRKRGAIFTPIIWILNYIVPHRRKRVREIKRLNKIEKLNSIKNRQRHFEEFRNGEINQSAILYRSITQLRANPPKADIYITGSDQVWNNSLYNPNTAGWFLDFGNDNIVRISYAASIGRNLSTDEQDVFKDYLKKFNKISVRENKALELCKTLGFKKAKVTVDPTLLLDRQYYDALASRSTLRIDSPYVFIYVLNIRTSDEIYWQQIESLAQKCHYDVKVVSSSGYLPAVDIIPNKQNVLATIPDWLALIKQSQVVFTTSFHGVVFCLLFHKPFYAVLLKNEFSSGNDRLVSLLERIGLNNRIISDDSELILSDDDTINWNRVDKDLLNQRLDSIEFLQSIL